MRARPLLLGCVLLAALRPGLARAQDKDWPCVQRLVPQLEAGQMWSGPPLDGAPEGPVPRGVVPLAVELIDPGVPQERVEARVAAFATELPPEARAAGLTALFQSSLERLNAERGHVIAGIKRYARRQQQLADKIAGEIRELEAVRKVPDADQAKIDELQTARDWDTRVYTDRQRQLGLVCDQPVRLEQRAFALARTIQGHLP
jgi:hypothetical protein